MSATRNSRNRDLSMHHSPGQEQADTETLDELSTPCILIEQRRLMANLRAMQARADWAGVALRPHTKTHKMVSLALLQRAAGSRGITVAKVGEAEVFSRAGFEDIRIAYTVVGKHKMARIAALGPGLSFCVDSAAAAQQASAVFARCGRVGSVLLEIDAGYGRCGRRWDDPSLVDFARQVNALPSLTVVGILTHEGNAYQAGKARSVMAETRDRMLSVAVRLREAGLATPRKFEISVGATPSAYHFENASLGGFSITEIRPGNYVFNDITQVNLGVCTARNCALTVLSTVISARRNPSGTEQFFLDAGRKILTSDKAPLSDAYGKLLYHARRMVVHPHARIANLSEEHGWGEVDGGSTFSVGDRVRLIPNHACVVVNTQNVAYLVDGDHVRNTWPVDARGQVQ